METLYETLEPVEGNGSNQLYNTSKCVQDRFNRIRSQLEMLFQLDLLQMRLGPDVLVAQIRSEKAEKKKNLRATDPGILVYLHSYVT